MDFDERSELNEQARAELLYPSAAGKVVYCQNCHEPIIGESANFNHHTIMDGMLLRVQQSYGTECIPEVIAYRYKMRNVSQMTKELKS